MILAQYLSAFEKFRADNIYKETYGEDWYWDGGEKIPARAPRKLEK